MRNTMIYLIGFAGTGKLTVAKEIHAKINGNPVDSRLIDNHYINNPILGLSPQDGSKPHLSTEWKYANMVRQGVLGAMKDLSPPDDNFIMTNVLIDKDPLDHDIYRDIKATAEARGANFIPVHLSCSLKENQKRIVQPERKTLFKEISPELAKTHHEKETIIQIDHPNRLDLDTTAIPAKQAANIILAHAQRCYLALQKTAPDPAPHQIN